MRRKLYRFKPLQVLPCPNLFRLSVSHTTNWKYWFESNPAPQPAAQVAAFTSFSCSQPVFVALRANPGRQAAGRISDKRDIPMGMPKAYARGSSFGFLALAAHWQPRWNVKDSHPLGWMDPNLLTSQVLPIKGLGCTCISYRLHPAQQNALERDSS